MPTSVHDGRFDALRNKRDKCASCEWSKQSVSHMHGLSTTWTIYRPQGYLMCIMHVQDLEHKFMKDHSDLCDPRMVETVNVGDLLTRSSGFATLFSTKDLKLSSAGP